MRYPLNQSQAGIYYASQMAEADSNYTISCLFTLPQSIDWQRLQLAIEQAVLNHPHLLDHIALDENDNPVWENPEKVEYTQTTEQAATIQDKMPEFAQDFDLQGERLFRIDMIATPQQRYLCLNIHHILIDGCGLEALLQDISAGYAGQALTAEHVTASVINEQEAQRRLSSAYEAEKQWYEEVFGGVEQVSLPDRDVTDEAEVGFGTALIPLAVDPKAVQAFARQHGIGISIPYTAAFAWTLHVFTGEDDISYTTFYHGREREQRHTLTMQVRTLPMLHHLGEIGTVADLLHETQTMLTALREKRLVGFGEVCAMSGYTADMSFIYQGRITDSALVLDGKAYHWEYLSKHEPGLKLNMQLQENDKGEVYLKIAYPKQDYTAAWVEEWAESYAHILNQLLVVEHLQDITPACAEQCQHLDALTSERYGNSDEWKGETMVSLFMKKVQEYPDHIAVVGKDEQYTYAELDAISSALAKVISEKVKKRADALPPVVSILIPRNSWMATAPLAAMKAGCAYQPLDASYPPERLQYMVQDAEASVVITTHEYLPLLGDYQGEAVFVEELKIESIKWKEVHEVSLRSELKADDLMVLLYTSGSTGVPKGVMLSHTGVLAYIHFYQREMQYTPETHSAAYASFGFDANLLDMYSALTMGSTVYIIPEEIRLDLEAIGDFVVKNRINNLFMTTQVAQQFALTYDRIGELKTLSMGGEKMMSIPLPSGYKVYNLYGPSECSIGASYKCVTRNEKNIPIGRAGDDVGLYVVDKHLHRLPIGAPGELLITGRQVGIGYLNLPEKTAQAFVEWEGQRAYRTGDIVRYRQDGDLEFVGRKDGQVKIRGFRIELKEVEAVIRAYPGITDVTVQAYDYPDGGKYITAYIVADEKVDVALLEQFIRDQKPPYMVPAYTMQLDKIPLNVNQKVDKKALPKPELGDRLQVAGDSKAAPLNVLEQQLMDIVDKAIHQRDFDITTPLIYVGLSSIAAMKVASAVYKQYGVSLDVKKLIKDASLQDIENAILTATLSETKSQTATLSEPEIQNSVPLTGAQKGIYLDWEVNRVALQYNVPLVLQLNKADIALLQSALTQVIQAHPALQVRLQQTDEGAIVMQQIDEAITIEQVRAEQAMDTEDLRQYIRPFNLLAEPLCRFMLVQEPEHTWLVMDIHHIIYDGLSAGILLQDLKRALEGEALQVEQYTLLDFARDEEQVRQSERYQEATRYFDTLIDDIDMTHYPDSEEKNEQMAIIAHQRTEISRASIEETCHQLGITPNSYFATIVAEVLHRVSREERVLFTTISNGRNSMQLMETIGMFVQTMVVESTKTKTSVAERMQAMHQQLLETLSRDFFPFSELAATHHFAPQVLYAYQDGVMANHTTINGQETPVCTLDLETAKVPLSVQIKGNEQRFVIEAEYDQSLYSAGDMQHLCSMLAAMAEQAVESSQPMSAMQMTTAADRPTIIERSYGGDLDYDRDRTVVDWMEYYAKQQPEHTAVVDYCSRLSYAELSHRTNILAHLLRENGVRKDTIVSIMLPRVKEFMVSYLAIHKAGGAYVPLDSEYPNERLIYMLQNSESKVLITTRALAEQKQKEGDFPAPEMIYIDEIDWNQTCEPINFAEKDGLAYMIYTSGSTGLPKGTMLEHRNLMAFASWRIHSDIEANPDNQFVCFPSFSFDASICDLIIPLFAGSTVHILHEDLRKDLDGLGDYITQNHIAGGSFPTQLGMALINHRDLPLQFIEMGGEKLVPTTPRSYRKINGYGPTEFTCCSSYYLVKDSDTDIPIGRPVPNTWSVIVDTDGHLMPWGMPGELCLIGEQMARGYWHLPEKTEQVFTALPNEFTNHQSPITNHQSRMYHTGDLAKYNADGQLVYLGRIDHQVKLRGFRIEMGEIEARMASYPDITATIAMVQEIGGSKHLVGYFVADKKIDTDALRTHLQQALTAYMVPDALVQLPAFPLTPNGKIDRKKLPIPELERSVEYIAPRTELETQICDIFRRITGAEQVGLKDDFFEIGGSSLLAIKAVIELTNLGRKVVYGDLFKLKTPEALAAHLNDNHNDNHNDNQYYRFDDYQYEAIDTLLKHNLLPQDPMTLRPLGTVLLTGATGYLGMHLLDYLVTETDSTIYCLVRPQGRMSGESRLKTLMVYYLTATHEELLGTRIHVLEDDITGTTLRDTLQGIEPDTIFNCAALVKHFVVGKEMDEVNVDGVANLIAIAEEKQARLIHVSTYSTAGYVPASYLTLYNEQQLHIGQCTDNEYIRTKYLSERLMLQAIADGRIDGKVMRVGNLMARAEDGEFQINMHSNAFLNNLKSLKVLGQITADMMAAPIEMSPIDCVAAAIGKLATTPSNMVLFHPFNNYSSSRTVIIDAMREIGYPMELVTPTTFQQSLQAALQDETKSQDMQGIIHYTTNIENGLAPLGASNFYTTQVLLWLNFRWPLTTREYVLALLRQLDGLAFFE